jgi:N-acyl-L-homoserine lactone synthetase
MIHAVSAVNQHLYARQLDRMFRMRHSFYVEGHGWSGLTPKGGLEVDEFDDENVVYLMSIDPFGDVAAAVRLNPTTGPTLLGKFADHSDEPLPRLDTVWDVSRWIAAPEHRRTNSPRWPSNHQRELMIGMLEFCQSRGLTHLTMLAELRLAGRILSYGWPLRYLGAPRPYEGGKGVAVAAEVEVGAHVGIAKVRLLVEALSEDLSGRTQEDRPRAVEMLVALSRLVEAAGASLEDSGEQARTACVRERIAASRAASPS